MVVLPDGLLDAGHGHDAFTANHADGAEVIERKRPAGGIDAGQAEFDPAHAAASGQ